MSEIGTIGVVIVAFNSAPVIAECLESVFASRDADLAVVVVDNDSTDSTVQVVEDWASGGVQSIEGYLAKHLAFLSFLDEAPSA